MSQPASGFTRALAALREAGVEFVLMDSRGAALAGIHRDEGQIDLMTSMAAFSYDELSADAATFRVADVEVRVGRLEKLLLSKERGGWPKHVEFLRAFEGED